MKKRWFPMALAVTLAMTLTIPAGAIDTEEYWEGYEQGYEEGYADGYTDGFQSGYFDESMGNVDWDSESEDWTAAELLVMGGVPGKINVKYNDRCIAFDAVWPENRNGRIMAPMRPILETMGAELRYHSGVVTVTLEDGRTLTHTVGTDVVTVTNGAGKTETVAMPCNSYVDDGATFIPVRFFAETLGLTVLWDGNYQTVVLVDASALQETYDPQMTALNLLLSELQLRQNPDQTYRETVDLALDLTVFDTIQGDQHMKATAKTDTLTSGAGFQTTLEVEASELMDVLMAQYETEGWELPTEDAAMLRLLSRLQAELRYNNETQTLYIQSPLIDLMMGQTTWLEQPLGDAFFWNVSAWNGAEPLTVTELVLLSRQQDVSMGNAYAVYLYDDAAALLQDTLTRMGDAQFTRSGATWILKTDNLLADFYGAPAVAYAGEHITMEGDLRITDRGSGRCDLDGSFSVDSGTYIVGLELTSRDSGGEATLEFHLKNQCKGTVSVITTRSVTDEPVEILPPVDDVFMALEDVDYY